MTNNVTQIASRKIPTVGGVWKKILEEQDLTDIDAIIFSSYLNKLAWEVDSKFLSELQYSSLNQEDFDNKKDDFIANNECFMAWWSNIGECDLKYMKMLHPYIIHTNLDLNYAYKHKGNIAHNNKYRRGALVTHNCDILNENDNLYKVDNLELL